MDSPQSVVSPLKTSSISTEPKQNANLVPENSSPLSRETTFEENETTNGNFGDFLGLLEVYVHHARDIHNICIYQKQDVYAKLCLTTDPEKSVSTKIINGGGRNPIFNENLRLNVRKVDSSLKCEIWMLSRVRNYLEDQLLGFALVPVSEILQNGKLEKEFALSSTDLFHSPAGFVNLTVSYVGAQLEVIGVPTPPTADPVPQDKECDLDKIEFPDPKVINENHQMVEEYFKIPCADLESASSETFVSSDTEKQVGESKNSPQSSVSTNIASSLEEEHFSLPEEEKSADFLDSESKASDLIIPVVTVNIEQEPKVVQQDIVDIYMKSMQQFTDSLAKMKLPLDFENGPTSSENSSSEKKSPPSKNSGSRVFYGSRAFF